MHKNVAIRCQALIPQRVIVKLQFLEREKKKTFSLVTKSRCLINVGRSLQCLSLITTPIVRYDSSGSPLQQLYDLERTAFV